MLHDRLKLTLVTALATSSLAILMATIIYYRSAFRATPDFVAVALWQLAIWLPWVALSPLIGWLNRRFTLQTMGAVAWFFVHLLFALVIATAHTGWFFQVSDLFSPYHGVAGTKYGAFAYFFIYWFVIDLFVYWTLLGLLHSQRSYQLYMERSQQVAQLKDALQDAEGNAKSVRPPPDSLQFFSVKKHDEQRVISVGQIDWIEAQRYYAALHVGDDVYLVRTSLADLAQKLDPERFVRIHRSTLVNIEFIRTLDTSGVILADGTSRRVSRSGKGELQKRIRQLA